VEQSSGDSKIKNAKMGLFLRILIVFAWLIMLIAINPSVPRFFISFGAGLLAFSIVLYRSQDKRGSWPWIIGSLVFIAILAILALARYLTI